MNDQLELRRLKLSDESAFIEAFNAFVDPKFAFASGYQPGMNFSEYVQKINNEEAGVNMAPGRVPGTLLFGFLGKAIVGRISIRHSLNDYLLNFGGHIGYGIVPAFRKRGFATKMLQESLIICKNELGLDRVLVTCDDDNIASAKVIEACGGVLENKLLEAGTQILKRRYWINLSFKCT